MRVVDFSRLLPRLTVCLSAVVAFACIEPAGFEGDAGTAPADAAGDVTMGGGTDGGDEADVGGQDMADGGVDGVVYRKKLTVARSGGDADVPGFVVLVDHADEDLKRHARQAENIRFVDGDGKVLPYEVVSYRATVGRIRAWVRLPALLAGDETNFWIEFGSQAYAEADGEVWEGFVGVWHFDEQLADGEVVSDSSPKGNDGTVKGGSPDVTAQGRLGGAIQLDGVDDHVRIPDHESLRPKSAITLSAWARVDYFPSSIMSRPATTITEGFGNSYQMWVSVQEKLIGSLSLDGEQISSAVSGYPLSEWHHVVMTWDGAEIRQYVDGDLAGTLPQSGTIDYDEADVYIGTDKNSDEGGKFVHVPLKGIIDEAWMRPDAASATEIAAWFENQSDPDAFLQWGELESCSACAPR